MQRNGTAIPERRAVRTVRGAGAAQMAERRAVQGSSVIFGADGVEQGDAVCADRARVAHAPDREKYISEVHGCNVEWCYVERCMKATLMCEATFMQYA